jgi:hypothetical protein
MLLLFSSAFALKDNIKRNCRADSAKTLSAFREELMKAFVHMEHSEVIPVKLIFDEARFPYTCYVLNNVKYVTFSSVSDESSTVELFSIEYQINRKVIDHYYKWVHQYTYKTSNTFLFPNTVDMTLRIFERLKNTHLLQRVSAEVQSKKTWFQARIGNEIVQPIDPVQSGVVYNVYLINEDASVNDNPLGYFTVDKDKVEFSIIGDKKPPTISPAKKAQLLKLSSGSLNTKSQVDLFAIKSIPVPAGNPFAGESKFPDSKQPIQPALDPIRLSILQKRIKGGKIVKSSAILQKEDLFATSESKDTQVIIVDARECSHAGIFSMSLMIATLVMAFVV